MLSERDLRPALPPKPIYTIVIIEDDPVVARTIECALIFSGHKVVTTNGETNFPALLGALKPDLLIADIILPDLDTIDLLTELRQSYSQMKIIGISGNPHLLRLAAKHGADHVLAKPFGFGELNALIQVAMR